MTARPYTLSRFVQDLRAITTDTQDPAEITRRVEPLARELALARTWLEPRHYTADQTQGFGVHVLHEEPDHTLLVFTAAWLPGRGALPHNHGTWAVVAGVDGYEKNTFWDRLDDRTRAGWATIRPLKETAFGPGDVLSLLPEAIHSVINETARVTVSLHVYGRNLNLVARSEFDPERGIERPVVLRMEGGRS